MYLISIHSSQDGDFIASSSKNITLKEKVLCAKVTNNPNDQTICQVALAYGGDWAAFIDQMLYEASVAYGDADFNTRAADQSGKLKAVENMNLIVQSAMCPTARSNGVNTTDITYAGPNNDPFNEMYTPTIPAAYMLLTVEDGGLGQVMVMMERYSRFPLLLLTQPFS